MFRAIVSVILLAAVLGCGKVVREKVAAPGSPEDVDGSLATEDLIVYGKLESDNLRKPTRDYPSAFGDGWCMAEDVSFEVLGYIQGSGPARLEFTQHTFNSCDSLVGKIGFGEAILFLSRNEYRGTWSEGAVRVLREDDEARIILPEDISLFLSFENFDELLSSYDEPFEYEESKSWESYELLEELKRRKILDFEVSRRKWPEMPTPSRDESHAYDEFFAVRMYRYIKVESLLGKD